jgi:hypothetical protein
MLAVAGHAAVFRCVDSNGVSTYSDRPCASPAAPAPAPSGPSAQDSAAAAPRAEKAPLENRAQTPKELKARQILLVLRLTPDSSAGSGEIERVVDVVAPDLVKHLDPSNAAWNPQNGRWHTMLEFVKTDLRKDLAAALRASDGQTLQAEAKEYAAHAQDADMDALIQYLDSPEGAHYIAFQNVVRSITNQSLRELLDQQPITAEQPSDAVIKQRQTLLSLGLEARLAADGGGPSLGSIFAGSPSVLDNAARREGTALDALYVEYEFFVPNFAKFTQSATAKRFFAAVEPAYRTGLALISTAAGGFSGREEFKYAERWQANYGPQLRNGQRVRVVAMQNRYPGSSGFNAQTDSAERMAIQCEQREDSAYYGRNRRSDPTAQAAALKGIQDKCRAEQNLAPY